MAKKLTIKERSKYYECLSRVLDFVNEQIGYRLKPYTYMGKKTITKDDGTQCEVSDYQQVQKDYDMLDDEDKAIVDAWRIVREAIEDM